MRVLIPLLILAGCSQTAAAFPGLTRLGYFSCSTCHVSSEGGDTLTPYGRSLSADRLSTWTTKGEEASPLQPPPAATDWLLTGGDWRGVAVDAESAHGSARQVIRMQSDLSMAVVLPHFSVEGQGGELGSVGPNGGKPAWRSYSAQASYDNVSVRAGRFYPRYGINMPEHVVNVRQALGFDDGEENLCAEATWLTESNEATAGGMLGAEEKEGNHERGFYASDYVNLGGQRLGASVIYGQNPDLSRRIAYGASAVVGGGAAFGLLEADYQSVVTAAGAVTKQAYGYAKLVYEPVQGLMPFIALSNSAPDLSDLHKRTEGYKVGLQWFPRPHFDFQLEYGPDLDLSTYTFVTSGYVMAHYYL